MTSYLTNVFDDTISRCHYFHAFSGIACVSSVLHVGLRYVSIILSHSPLRKLAPCLEVRALLLNCSDFEKLPGEIELPVIWGSNLRSKGLNARQGFSEVRSLVMKKISSKRRDDRRTKVGDKKTTGKDRKSQKCQRRQTERREREGGRDIKENDGYTVWREDMHRKRRRTRSSCKEQTLHRLFINEPFESGAKFLFLICPPTAKMQTGHAIFDRNNC